jgi:hypothetical protein
MGDMSIYCTSTRVSLRYLSKAKIFTPSYRTNVAFFILRIDMPRSTINLFITERARGSRGAGCAGRSGSPPHFPTLSRLRIDRPRQFPLTLRSYRSLWFHGVFYTDPIVCRPSQASKVYSSSPSERENKMAEKHSPEPVGRVVRTSSAPMPRLDSQRRALPSDTGFHTGVVRPMPSSKGGMRPPINACTVTKIEGITKIRCDRVLPCSNCRIVQKACSSVGSTQGIRQSKQRVLISSQ